MAKSRARDSTSPTPEAFPRADQSYAGNSEEIQPLAFETEAELFSVIARLREGLKAQLSRKWLAEGGDPEGIEAVEGLVLNQFFDKLGPVIGSNCTIGGVLWSESMSKSSKTATTQPFQEILHERVLKYQDSLFEARTINVNARKELPIETAESLAKILARDQELLERMRAANEVTYPDEDTTMGGVETEEKAGMSRKRKTGTAADTTGVTKEQAETSFLSGVEAIDRLKSDVGKGIAEAKRAKAVAVDSGNLV